MDDHLFYSNLPTHSYHTSMVHTKEIKKIYFNLQNKATKYLKERQHFKNHCKHNKQV